MDKNNCKLKILSKYIKAYYQCHMTAYAAHTINYSTHLLTAEKKKTRAMQKSTFRKMEV